MNDAAIVLTRGLPEAQLEAAVEVFDEAFAGKMRMVVPDRERRLAFFARSFEAPNIITATRGDELLGLVGLRSRDGERRDGMIMLSGDPRRNSDLLGWVGATWAQAILRLLWHRPAARELYVDAVAVAPAARGAGIGTRLMDEAASIARAEGMRWLRLDVIDTNTGAQALYERLGYRVTGRQRFGALRRFIGFGGTISMELDVEARGEDTATP